MKADELQTRIGRVIRYYRERKGFSQEGFADQIGIHRVYYGAVERGLQNLTLRRLQEIADGLGMTIWKLFHEAETKSPADFPPPRKPGRPVGTPQRRR